MECVGPVLDHVKLSTGGETSVLKHYCTTTNNSYGSGWEHFVPRPRNYTGSGFNSNNRGQIFYTSHLDEIDNPKMGEIIKKNYKTITHKDYVGYKIPSGNESLPCSTIYQPDGFVRDSVLHIPTQLQLQNQYINGFLQNYPGNISGKHRPLLHQINLKDPIMMENFGHGPSSMSTEYKTRYDGKQYRDLGPGTVGKCEMSGFTQNNKTEEPLEGRTDAAPCYQDVFGPPVINSRPTGISIYNTHFRPFSIPNGREPLPNIDMRADVSNGFTKGNKAVPDFVELHPEKVYDRPTDIPESKLQWLKKNDPAEYANVMSGAKSPTMMNSAYQGKQIHPIGETFRDKIGNREPTGHTSNEDTYTVTRDNPERFITYNMTKYYDPTLIGDERFGHVNGEIMPIKENGFSRDVKIHQIEPQLDAFKNCSRFAPYQSRSIIARETVTLSPTKVIP